MNLRYKYRFPDGLVEQSGYLREFKQDASIVSIEIKGGAIYNKILLIWPDYIGAIKNHEDLPFDPDVIIRIFQTEEDLNTRSTSSWCFLLDNTQP